MAIADETDARGQALSDKDREPAEDQPPTGENGRAILFGRTLADSEKALRMARSAYAMAADRRSRDPVD